MTITDLITIIPENLGYNGNLAQMHRRRIAKFMKENYKEGMQHPAFFEYEQFFRDHNKSMANATTISIIARFFSDQELVRYYYEMHNLQEKALIEHLSWDSSIDYASIKKIFKEDLFTLQKTTYNYILQIKPAFKSWEDFIHMNDRYYGQLRSFSSIIEYANISFSFPRFIQLAFREILPKPVGYYLKSIQLPKNRVVFTGEVAIHKELPALLLLIQQGVIQISSVGWLKESNLKAVQKKLQLHSFTGDPGYLKAFMMAPLLLNTKGLNPHAQVLEILTTIYQQKEPHLAMLQAVLYPYNGIKEAYRSYRLDRTITGQILDLLQILPADGWVLVDNLQTYIHYHLLNFEFASTYAAHYFTLKAPENRKLEFENAQADEKLQILKTQIVKGSLMMAASFGLLDLAYDWIADENSDNTQPDKQQEHFAEDFTACKITAMGLHICQGQKDYTLPTAAQPNKYKLSETDLTIEVEGDIKIASGLLSNWTEVVNATSLRIDREKILQNCHSKTELIDAFLQLNKTLGLLLPKYWKQVFMQTIQNADKIQFDNMAVVYRLDPTDKQLHRCLAQDPILKKIILKAERYSIIIERTHLQTFHKRLAKIGYMTNKPNLMQTDSPHFEADLENADEQAAAFDQLVN